MSYRGEEEPRTGVCRTLSLSILSERERERARQRERAREKESKSKRKRNIEGKEFCNSEESE